MKQCTECRKHGLGPKPESDFCKGTDRDGLQSMCREHTRAYNRAWAKRNPEKNREKGKRFRDQKKEAYRRISVRANVRRYGLSEAQYTELYAKQNECCAICDIRILSIFDPARVRRGHAANEVARVDHDHSTGTVRGLLCFGCNVGLGKFRDDEKLLLKAARYLRESATLQEISRGQSVKLQGEIGPVYRYPDSSRSRGSRREELSPF